MVPVVVGLNCTPTVQMLLAGTDVPQGILPPVVDRNWPLATMLVIGTAVV
jgi:hypothetical protein